MSSGPVSDYSEYDRTAPAFTLAEHAEIAVWARKMQPRGLHCQFRLSFRHLEEGLLVIPRWEDEPRWLLSRTDSDSVFVMLFPGVSTFYPTVTAALASITKAIDAEDAKFQTVG